MSDWCRLHNIEICVFCFHGDRGYLSDGSFDETETLKLEAIMASDGGWLFGNEYYEPIPTDDNWPFFFAPRVEGFWRSITEDEPVEILPVDLYNQRLKERKDRWLTTLSGERPNYYS